MKKFNFPKYYSPYIDKYFLRAKYILEQEKLNPIVKAQVFIRKGNCRVFGIDEVIELFKFYNKKVKVWALKEGTKFAPGEAIMMIEAPIQEIIDLETMYLGILSAETTKGNSEEGINLYNVAVNMKKIVDLIKPRTVSYFGARHWRYDRDYDIARSCKLAGAKNCSTDAGAKAWGEDKKGIGTIPHALEAIFHKYYGISGAVLESTIKFHDYIDPKVPRIALIDYANREIADSVSVFSLLCDRLNGIRIDTCGENIMQDGIAWHRKDYPYKYWFGNGVTVLGVYKIIKALEKQMKNHYYATKLPKIILSSGFGNPEKVKAFLDFEKEYNVKLFDALGVGGVFESRMATMDIISVDNIPISKVGRKEKNNSRLHRII